MSPTAPLRPCNHPGCPELVPKGRCTAHQRKLYRDQQQYRRSTKAAGYSGPWIKLRRIILNRDPICKACKRAPATEVDHITPKVRGGLDTMANLQGLCKPCHSSKTAKERA